VLEREDDWETALRKFKNARLSSALL
jgi:hypothetical protein